MFNSNSPKDLYNCIISIDSDSKEANNTVEYIKDYCFKNSLNFDKVVKEIIRVVEKSSGIKSIHPFVKGVAKKLDKTTFGSANITYVPNTQPIINDLRDKKIVMLADDTVWLSVAWKIILNHTPIDVNEAIALNHKIIAYMLEHNERTFEEYKSLLKKSKALRKYDIDWQSVEARVAVEIMIWNAKLEEMGSEE